MKNQEQIEVIKEDSLDTTNPFNIGVSYDMFLKNVDKNNTIDVLLKKHKLKTDQIKWIKEELNNHNKNK